MAELAQGAEVYEPRTLQVWRALVNWLTFFFQIFVQIVRATPSLTQVLSYVGIRHRVAQFKPLPVQEGEIAASSTTADAAHKRADKLTVCFQIHFVGFMVFFE
ncbi:hypothetical protein Leryth_006969 [Lithospermum erythrorhizon]|nr:hypothetical protein Leryth_006969 [Lithospermum erythrorhizon]